MSRRPEPWPFIVAGLLAAMISVSLGFFWIALRYPDTVVTEVHDDVGPGAVAERVLDVGPERSVQENGM